MTDVSETWGAGGDGVRCDRRSVVIWQRATRLWVLVNYVYDLVIWWLS